MTEVVRLLPYFKIVHIRREQNQVVHNLAKLALQREFCKVMRFNIPPEVVQYVERDNSGASSSNLYCNTSIS
jgi:hypothetical protein